MDAAASASASPAQTEILFITGPPWALDTKAGGGPAALVDQVADAIQAAILSGELPLGVRLRQETLAAQFGVSRTPVREALRKLEARGIVELEPHRGAVVRGPTAREIRDAYEVRAELEGLAAELATARIRDRELHALREAEAMFRHTIAELVGDRRRARIAPAPAPADGEWARANDLFHRAIQDAAGNRRLVEVVENLHRSFPRDLTWAALADSSVLLEQNVDEHHRILEAIERGDAEEARRQMIDHVRGAGELIARRFEQLESDVGS